MQNLTLSHHSKEARLFDRAGLNRQIEAIFQDSRNFPALERVIDHFETLVRAGRRRDLQRAAEPVIALLSLDLDDLRRAALLSLMVRLTGKRNFEPVAAYVLEKRATYVTGQG